MPASRRTLSRPGGGGPEHQPGHRRMCVISAVMRCQLKTGYRNWSTGSLVGGARVAGGVELPDVQHRDQRGQLLIGGLSRSTSMWGSMQRLSVTLSRSCHYLLVPLTRPHRGRLLSCSRHSLLPNCSSRSFTHLLFCHHCSFRSLDLTGSFRSLTSQGHVPYAAAAARFTFQQPQRGP